MKDGKESGKMTKEEFASAVTKSEKKLYIAALSVVRNTSLEEIGDSFTYEADHGSMEFFDILSSARLDDKSGRIVMLRFFYGYTLEEISKITNTPLSNVTSKYYRALEKIRKTIK